MSQHSSEKKGVTRRGFLKTAGFALAGLSISKDVFGFTKIQSIGDPLKEYAYRGWEDLYRKEWTWDRVQYATHSVGCVGKCSLKVYSKNGIPLREEQTATYPVYGKHTPGKYKWKCMGKERGEYIRYGPGGKIPSFSPRGCQKGIIYSDYMKQGNFLKYPLKRAGERGERRWKRISWEQAFDEIAEKVIDITVKDPGSMITTSRPFSQLSKGSSERVTGLLGGSLVPVSAMVGDAYPAGHTVLIGRIGSTRDDWFTADLFIGWTQNFTAMAIPDAHFAHEAKYNGAKIIVVDPNHNVTAAQAADLYVPIRMGSDSYLAAAICNTIIKEKKYDADFLKEQSDLPFLVRLDNKKFLAQKDMKPDGKEFQYYFWDTNTNQAVEAPGCLDSPKDKQTLDIVKLGFDPALEGRFTVKTADGKNIECTTVFEMTKAGIAKYDMDSDMVREATGLHPSVIRTMTDWMLESKSLHITNGYNCQKHYDGYQSERLKILILTLTGQIGGPGAYHQTYEGMKLEGGRAGGGLHFPDQPARPEFGIDKPVKGGKQPPSVGIYHEIIYGNSLERSKKYFATAPLKEQIGFDVNDMEAFMKDAFEKKYLPSQKSPKIALWHSCNNYRNKTGQQWWRENYLPKLELLIVTELRMSASAQSADYVLSAATDYERWDGRETTSNPFFTLFGQAVKPMFDRKTDWQIYAGLCKAIQEKAKAKGIKGIPYEYWSGTKQVKRTIDLQTIHDEYIQNGELDTDEKAIKWHNMKSKGLGGEEGYEKFAKEGYVKFRGPAKYGNYEDDAPARSMRWQVIDKKPSKTNTGRFQFYVDHEYHIKLNQMTPKPQYTDKWKGGPVMPRKLDGSPYPFVMNYPHTKWGIHSSFRENQWLMRLHRGDVHLYLNTKIMKEKGIKDMDMVRVHNHMGEWFARAKEWPGLPPYIVFTEHGWDHQWAKNWTQYNNLNCEFLNPLEMAGGKRGHIVYTGNHTGNRIYYETGVDIEKVEG
ncbi:MAG: molybdopterin-dependent oxidoreductase [Nitrospirota bacterium]